MREGQEVSYVPPAPRGAPNLVGLLLLLAAARYCWELLAGARCVWRLLQTAPWAGEGLAELFAFALYDLLRWVARGCRPAEPR